MDNVTIEVLDENDIEEYSKLMNEVMEEFNKEEINGFQLWFTSVEGVTCRREYGFDDGSLNTVQFAAKCDGKIIGALEVESKNHIQSFFVKKEFQNKGIGKLMLRYSLDFFEENGTEVIGYSVLASDYAIDIYKSFGFVGEGKMLRWKIKRDDEWTCSGTRLLPSQVSHFFGRSPAKMQFFKEVVQKLKFPNNFNILFHRKILSMITLLPFMRRSHESVH